MDILEDGRKIGSYIRNYNSLIRTFVPFIQNGQVFALYSPNYTGTRLMRLPDCQDLGGEEPNTGGFCPAEFYVPYLPEQELTGTWGFISGCVWGDDSTWKVQHLDLSRAAEGVLVREARFGHLPLPRNTPIEKAIDLTYYRADDGYAEIEFSMNRTYSMKRHKFDDDEDYHKDE